LLSCGLTLALLGCAHGAPNREDAGAAFDASFADAAQSPSDAGRDRDASEPAQGDDDAGDDRGHDAAMSEPPDPDDDDAGQNDAAAALCDDGNAPGDCGCPGESGAAPAGSACDDGACPLSESCDGDGHCGSASDCAKPDPGCGPQLQHDGHLYYVCPVLESWSDARDACGQNPRFDLIRIDDAAEQVFLEDSIGSLTDDVWLNATDMTAGGQWAWMDDGTVFWNGSSGGAPVMNRFQDWGPGEPSANGGCVRHGHTNSVWLRTACAEMHFFACEAAPP
jgi:hypothetical protein